MSAELTELLQLYDSEDVPGTVEAVRDVKAKALGGSGQSGWFQRCGGGGGGLYIAVAARRRQYW